MPKEGRMPEITRFDGIVMKIFFRGERNPPHFHAVYGEFNGVIDIEGSKMIEGDLPQKIVGVVETWARLYKKELMSMWNEKRIVRLPPLR